MRYYKDDILNTLIENNNNSFNYRNGVLKKMLSPAMYRNETLSKFLDKIDENLVSYLDDIELTKNLRNPSKKETQI